jgi:hypothetical protein
VTRREGAIDGSTRVMRWEPREYVVIAQPNDTLDKVAERITAWNAGTDWKKQPEQRGAMVAKVKPLLANLNPDAGSSPLAAGTRIVVPDRSEIQAALKATQ